jgi:hypothetical protein
MTRFVYIMIGLMLITCIRQKQYPIINSNIELISIGNKYAPSFYIKYTLINNSDHQCYLAEFNRTFPLLIKNDKGKICNDDFFTAEILAKSDLYLDTLINYYNRDSTKYVKVINKAVEQQLITQKKLNFFRSKDTIFSHGLRTSLHGVYEDILLIEPRDTICSYTRINSLVQSGKRYDIIFDYKDKVHVPIIVSPLFVYKHIEGRDDKYYFTIFSTKYLKSIDSYVHYKRRIQSNTLSINI